MSAPRKVPPAPPDPSARGRRAAAAWALAASCALLAVGLAAARPGDRAARGVPVLARDEGYAGAETCGECHASNHASWAASYHSRMTQAATPAAVLAPFAGSTPILEGRAWRLEREDQALFATPTTPAGEAAGPRRRVVLTTGSHHYQLYWMEPEGEDGMEPLPLVWHVARAQWVPRKTLFLMPPTLHTASEAGRWTQTCIKCHATNGTPEHASDGAVRVADLGIACEACHGPGAAHVAFHRTPEHERAPDAVEPTLVDPQHLDHVRSTEVCGQCHGFRPLTTPEQRTRWRREGFAYRPGEDAEATRPLLRGVAERNPPEARAFLERNPELLAEAFWPDGIVRVSGRESNGLVESPCHQRGTMSCLSCHEMHPSAGDPRPPAQWADDQLKRGMDGPEACLQCHADYGEPERLREHTRHAPGSSGADCLNCHMPYNVYGLTKAIRSHTITSPDVRASVLSGRPDACNLCHLDRSLGWTADRLHAWYGIERPPLDPDRETTSAAVLWALEGDAGTRALIAWALGWDPARAISGTGWMPYLLSTLLQDPYDAVRWIAGATLRKEQRYADFDMDFTQDFETQRMVVRKGLLPDWQREGLIAAPDRRGALLIRDDGKLDEERFWRHFSRRDPRLVRLAE